MSDFDEGREAAITWIHEQMDHFCLTLEDLEAAGCFDHLPEAEPAPEAEPTVSTPVAETPAIPVVIAPPRPAATYRNALGQVWDGTGECPDWLQRALNAGQTMDFYRVD